MIPKIVVCKEGEKRLAQMLNQYESFRSLEEKKLAIDELQIYIARIKAGVKKWWVDPPTGEAPRSQFDGPEYRFNGSAAWMNDFDPGNLVPDHLRDPIPKANLTIEQAASDMFPDVFTGYQPDRSWIDDDDKMAGQDSEKSWNEWFKQYRKEKEEKAMKEEKKKNEELKTEFTYSGGKRQKKKKK